MSSVEVDCSLEVQALVPGFVIVTLQFNYISIIVSFFNLFVIYYSALM